MACKVEYKSSVSRDLKKIDRSQIERLLGKLEETLSENPDSGSPLKGQYRGIFKYRIGNYRVMYVKTKDGVLVLRIRHRGKVY